MHVHSLFRNQLKKKEVIESDCRSLGELSVLHGARSDVTAHLDPVTRRHLDSSRGKLLAGCLMFHSSRRCSQPQSVFTWCLSLFTARLRNLQSAPSIRTFIHSGQKLGAKKRRERTNIIAHSSSVCVAEIGSQEINIAHGIPKKSL